MSGFIDETLNLTIDIPALVVESITDFIETRRERRNLAREVKRQREDAFLLFSHRIEHDKEKLKESIYQLESSLDFKRLGISNKEEVELKKAKDYNLFLAYTNLSKIQYYNDNIEDLFYLLNEQGADVFDLEQQYYLNKQKINNIIEKKNYQELSKFFEDLQKFSQSLLKTSNEEIKRLKLEKIERVNRLLYVIENPINMPHHYIFENEILKEIEHQQNTNENERLIGELINLQEKVFKIEEEFYSLDFIEDYAEIENLVNSVIYVMNNDEYSISTKLEMIKLRYEISENVYLKAKHNNAHILVAKEKYDEAFKVLHSLEVYLQKEITQYNFKYSTYEKQIKELEKLIVKLSKEAETKQEIEFIQKTIREEMINLQLEHLVSRKTKVGVQDIYHIENGNVVTVNIDKNKNVRYFVSGVKMDGVAKDELSIVKSMEKFCELKIEMDNRLKKENYFNVKVNELLIPDLKYAEEISLPENIHYSMLEKIRQARLERIEVKKLKQRAL